MKFFRRNRGLALRVSVVFHDTVVEDRVFPRGQRVVLGDGGDVEVPPPADSIQLASVVWDSEKTALLRRDGGGVEPLSAQKSAEISAGPVSVHCSLVPQFRHARPSLFGEGDIVLAVAILGMSVLAMQLEALFRMNQEPPPAQMAMDPSVEYIVRLLAEDYDGAQGRAAGDTGEQDLDLGSEAKEIDSFFLPSGTITDLDRPRGGEVEGDQNRVPEREESGEGEFQPLPSEDSVAPLEVLALEDTDGGEREIASQSFDERFQPLPSEKDDAPLSPTEEQQGWGFYDWYDTRDARVDRDAIDSEIEMARERLAIDPDSPWALTQLGYYQYLAFDYEGCKETYARFIELYPSEAAGYNNLALVYKRLGEYPKEEAHYRLALALDPEDTYVLNNLAVNLAHQGRFDEALGIMKRLRQIQPDDPYADLHRSKIAASMGEDGEALMHLENALVGMAKLDTLHHIEFRQDIRVDPSFETLRETEGFSSVLLQYYGEDALPLLAGQGEESDG
ncbi:MAG: tetratricopeptide repeat protein [Myxococcota bacterium]|nr:tetratricopeptide repeat protein [Myxococcota bacterium]